MVKCLVIGDPHFKVKNVTDTELMTERAVELAREGNYDFIVCLGDVLDRHESIHVDPLERSVDFLSQLEDIAPLYVIIGNHDRPNNSDFLTTHHPFTALKKWKNTKVVDRVLVDTVEDHKFAFVPYVAPGRFKEALQSVDFDIEKYNAIFAHQEFRDARMGAIRSTEGDPWPLDYPLVISGHIHDYQQLQGNLIYVGTPFQHAFGDTSDKTVSTFVFGKDFSHERHSLGLPLKKIVYLTCEEAKTYTPPDDCKIKAVIRGSTSDIKSLLKRGNQLDIVRKSINVAFKDTSSICVNDTPTSVSFVNSIKEAIANDNDLLKLWQQIFQN